MATARRVLAVALVVACAAGCAGDPAPVSAPSPAHLAASTDGVRIAQRLAAPVQSVPDVVGLDLEAARAALADARVHVVAFDEQAQIFEQHPLAGAAWPADGRVVLWVGQPPGPGEGGVAGDDEARDAPAGSTAGAGGGVESPAASNGAPATTASPEAVAPVPSASAPAAPAAVVVAPAATTGPPAPPPRTSPRVLPPTAPGTVLSGTASFYGAELAGRPTACGGPFDPAALTLATRELRCGTVVLVTGPRGSVTATATDFGPAEWTRRRFDLSAATFAAVADPRVGVVEVRVLVLEP